MFNYLAIKDVEQELWGCLLLSLIGDVDDERGQCGRMVRV